MRLVENEDIDEAFGKTFIDNVKKLGKRRKCRNKTKENVTFELNMEIFKFLIRKVKIFQRLSVL